MKYESSQDLDVMVKMTSKTGFLELYLTQIWFVISILFIPFLEWYFGSVSVFTGSKPFTMYFLRSIDTPLICLITAALFTSTGIMTVGIMYAVFVLLGGIMSIFYFANTIDNSFNNYFIVSAYYLLRSARYINFVCAILCNEVLDKTSGFMLSALLVIFYQLFWGFVLEFRQNILNWYLGLYDKSSTIPAFVLCCLSTLSIVVIPFIQKGLIARS